MMIHRCNRFGRGAVYHYCGHRAVYDTPPDILWPFFHQSRAWLCLPPIRLDRPTNAYTLPTKSCHSSSMDKMFRVQDAVQGLPQVGVVETKPSLEHSGRDAFSAG